MLVRKLRLRVWLNKALCQMAWRRRHDGGRTEAVTYALVESFLIYLVTTNCFLIIIQSEIWHVSSTWLFCLKSEPVVKILDIKKQTDRQSCSRKFSSSITHEWLSRLKCFFTLCADQSPKAQREWMVYLPRLQLEFTSLCCFLEVISAVLYSSRPIILSPPSKD